MYVFNYDHKPNLNVSIATLCECPLGVSLPAPTLLVVSNSQSPLFPYQHNPFYFGNSNTHKHFPDFYSDGGVL